MTEAEFLRATRTAYDTVAVSYAELLHDELANRPLDRAILGTFAELSQQAEPGPVADIGCGPGRVTAYLHSIGLTSAFGIDLSPGMIAEARRRYPGPRFEVGSMLGLELADASLNGVVAWYSVIHVPPARQPEAFAEFARVLKPGGQFLMGFQIGDEVRHIEFAYGHEVALDAYRLSPDRISTQLADAGITVTTRVIRQPEGLEKTLQACLLGQKTA